ncbi:DNA photolyase [bacterium]|nr:DNA photolyase [bacterium]
MSIYKIEKFIIHEELKESRDVKVILEKYPGVPFEIVSDAAHSDELTLKKGGLYFKLQKYNGQFLTKCPGTPNHICCGYQVISSVMNCHLGCSYCILQGYYHSKAVTINLNSSDLLGELERKILPYPERFFRIGTGEFSDSLAYEEIYNFCNHLVPFFSGQSNVLFEIKSKTGMVNGLLDIEHGPNIMVSWSVAPESIIEKEELFTAPLITRLKAARECQDAGYLLGFHFDPMIYYPDWEMDYKRTVEQIFDYVKPSKVVWISLGAFRIPPHFKSTIIKNFPKSKIVYGELFPGLDGKLRYLKQIRVELFGKMYRWLKGVDKNLCLYLCMESDRVWMKSFGWSPGYTGNLANILDERALYMISNNRSKA